MSRISNVISIIAVWTLSRLSTSITTVALPRELSRRDELKYKGKDDNIKRMLRLEYEDDDIYKDPTIAPSDIPSIYPSDKPTRVPSYGPTTIPTLFPSTMPTTPAPSDYPTSVPSVLPSMYPSISPSQIPTKSPSSMPSDGPSKFPSMVPSKIPTNEPTQIPSLTPSDLPSLSPSQSPSEVPSIVPSETPSSVPSNRPTGIPSQLPSEKPSEVPTLSPTDIPSNMPTIVPTDFPSFYPSNVPTSIPSNAPSDVPSFIPSSAPSDEPSLSQAPSGSDIPTSFPSISQGPSMEPSDLPSSNPSSVYGELMMKSLISVRLSVASNKAQAEDINNTTFSERLHIATTEYMDSYIKQHFKSIADIPLNWNVFQMSLIQIGSNGLDSSSRECRDLPQGRTAYCYTISFSTYIELFNINYFSDGQIESHLSYVKFTLSSAFGPQFLDALNNNKMKGFRVIVGAIVTVSDVGYDTLSNSATPNFLLSTSFDDSKTLKVDEKITFGQMLVPHMWFFFFTSLFALVGAVLVTGNSIRLMYQEKAVEGMMKEHDIFDDDDDGESYPTEQTPNEQHNGMPIPDTIICSRPLSSRPPSSSSPQPNPQLQNNFFT